MLVARILCSAALVATTAFASTDSIVRAVDNAAQHSKDLSTAVNSWVGSRPTTQNIIYKTWLVYQDVLAASHDCDASENLPSEDARRIITSSNALVAEYNRTAEIFIQAKPKFDKVDMSNTILKLLEFQESTTARYNKCFIKKVPEEMKSEATEIAYSLENSLVLVIRAYKS